MTETTGYSGSGLVHIKNRHLDSTEEDLLENDHLDLGTKRHNLPAMFGDLKFVCVGGSPNRMRAFAQFMHEELGLVGDGEDLADICVGTDRHAMSRAGPLLSVSHRMGIPSVSIMLHELIKLLHHAKCQDVTIMHIGTSGGLKIEAGSVVITDTAVDSSFKPWFEQVVLDDVVVRNTELDKDLAEELLACSKEIPVFPTLIGHTMCTYDFCEATAAWVALLDRLEGDQIQAPHEVLWEFQQWPQRLVAAFIQKCLGLCPPAGNALVSSN